MTFHPDQLQDLSGKVYIVTGATSGIGLYTAFRLAEHGAHVYVCARSVARGQSAVDTIKGLYSNAKLSILTMDHESLASVNAAAEKFKTLETKLHGLVNNAGIMATPLKITQDGYEAQWQTNYVAHWLFTWHLTPLILATSQNQPVGVCRIVNVTSDAHLGAPGGGINFNDTAIPNGSNMNRYGQSKVANILHAKVLHQMYGPGSPSAKSGRGEIWVCSVHPGLVKTGLLDKADQPLWLRMIAKPYVTVVGRYDSDMGAWTNIFCVASQYFKKEDSGIYFRPIAKRNGRLSAPAKNAELAQKLEAWTKERMVREKWIENKDADLRL